MKRLYPALNSGEVPEALDRRILAAAAFQARKNRARRVFQHWMWSGAAAAAAFLIAGGIFFLPGGSAPAGGEPGGVPSREELLALSDWTRLEQESFNLSFEFYSGRQAVAELADVRNP